MLRKVLFIVLFSVFFMDSGAQNGRTQWVDSVFRTLDRDAKIGQLFMVPVSSYASTDEIDLLIAQLTYMDFVTLGFKAIVDCVFNNFTYINWVIRNY